MLVILSEIDCRRFLAVRGVFPDEFYMDLDECKNHVLLHQNVSMIILLGGTCHFRKRKICEYAMQLVKQIEDGTLKTVKDLVVLSDTVLPNVKQYYKYDVLPTDAILYSGWDKKGKKPVNILKNYKGESKRAIFYDAIKEPPNRITESDLKDDELLKVVKIPNLIHPEIHHNWEPVGSEGSVV